MKRTYFAIALALALVGATPALAVDLSTPINQLNGKPLMDQFGKPDPQTLGGVLESTLLITEASTMPPEKNKRFWLAFKIHDKKDVTFSPEEIVMLKELVGKYQTTLVAGQVMRLLDPAAKPE